MPRFDSQRWAALTPYLDQVLELPDAARGAWLAALATTNPDVAAELTTLLARDRMLDAEGFLAGEPPRPGTSGLTGQTIGAYTLKGSIGHGGMGSVWLAERNDGRFERQAAVKLLNIALAGRGEPRFRREGAILARLSHPHIAQLIDAGVAPSGQPYLVLEHVAGQPITQYCETRALDVRQRVALFLDVLDAVGHAHANLIVHRDIKPSNVLVTDDGRVKLLDFGIAKLLEDEQGTPSATRLTADGGGMTLEFAAPEQVSGGTISTATDVYSLAVLLFVLLTRRHPAEPLLKSPVDLIDAVVNVEAPRSSDVVADARLRRELRGDLDTIIGKALKKPPAARYGSVVAMAEDLRRYLAREPIAARRDSVAYRAATFVRRRRWPLTAALVAFAVLGASLFVVNGQRQMAENRFRQLRQLSQQVFALDQRLRDLQGATEARRALVTATLAYLDGLSSDAGVDVDLMQEVADGYWQIARIQGVPTGLNLGDLAKAEENLSKAQAFIDRVLGERPQDPRALERAATIASDRMILAESERRVPDALRHLRTAVVQAGALLDTGRASAAQQDVARTLYGNASIASANLHHYDEAVQYAERGLEISRQRGDQRMISVALSLLANTRRLSGDLPGALKAIGEARDISDQATYANETVRMFDRYGLLLRASFIYGDEETVSLNQPEQAIIVLREAFEMQEAAARRDAGDTTSRSRIGTVGRELGTLLLRRHPGDALAVYDTAVRRLGEVTNNVRAKRDIATILAASADALRRLDRQSDAEQRLNRALEVLTATGDYPARQVALDSDVYLVLKAIADHHAATGEAARAIEEHEELLARVTAVGPDVENDLRDANELSLLLDDLARLYRTRAMDAKAAALDSRRLALWEHWNRKLPDNPFVRRRLAAASAPPGPSLP